MKNVLKYEPVRVFTFIGALIPIVTGLLSAFGAIRWTAADSSAVTVAYAAFMVALGEFARGAVTPVAKLSSPPPSSSSSLSA